MCSPDKGTFFIYNRSSYHGQLLNSGYRGYFYKTDEDRESAYQKNCNTLLNSDDFIEIEW